MTNSFQWARNLANTAGVTQVAWLESAGYTVNLITVPAESRVFGLATNETEFYPQTGKLCEVR